LPPAGHAPVPFGRAVGEVTPGVQFGLQGLLGVLLHLEVDRQLDVLAGDRVDPLVSRLASMQTKERTTVWRDLTAQRLEQRRHGRSSVRTVTQEVEELLAQIDFLRGEVESVRSRLGKRH